MLGLQPSALSGIKVLDLSTMMAGPFGAQMLGDLGAEIIKVETIEGDGTRYFPPHVTDGDSLYFWSLNRNKKSICIDLKTPEGLALFYELVKQADVVWDNFRAGIKEKLKIDYASVKQHNPAIISASITAFGTANPHDSDQPSFDLCIQAMSGVLDMTGEPEHAPVKMGVPMADLGSGWYAVVGVLAALLARSKTGVGQSVDVSMLDGLASLHTYEGVYYLHSGDIPTRIGTKHRSVVPYQIFPTKTIYIAIVGTLDKFWERICEVLSIDKDSRFANVKGRFQHREEIVALMTAALMKRPCEEWVKEFQKVSVPCGPVNTMDKALSEPCLVARNMVVEVERNGQKVKLLGNPIKMSANIEILNPPPQLGADTDSVLTSWLGYSEEHIEKLRQTSIIK